MRQHGHKASELKVALGEFQSAVNRFVGNYGSNSLLSNEFKTLVKQVDDANSGIPIREDEQLDKVKVALGKLQDAVAASQQVLEESVIFAGKPGQPTGEEFDENDWKA